MKRKENNAPTLREVISKTFKIIKEYKKPTKRWATVYSTARGRALAISNVWGAR